MRKFFKYIFLSLCFFVTTANFNFVLANIDDNETVLDELEVNSIALEASSSLSTSAPITNSRAYVVYDRVSNTILFGKDELEERKMASTTKIMSAIVIIENCDLTDSVTVSSKAAGTGGSRLGLSTNSIITVNDLLYGLMLCSRK